MSYGLPIALISNSSWLHNQISKRFGRDSYRIEHAVSEPDLFRTTETAVESKFLKPAKINIVSYCNTSPLKGWKYGLEAMKIVQLKYPDIEWVTYGWKMPLEDVKITQLGKISNSELAGIYKQAHIGFSSSLYESFPLPPLEMMACGCAVAATPHGAEAYAKDYENCLIAEPRSSAKLADKIIYLIEHMDFSKKMAINGIRTSQKFDWNRSSKKLLEIIDDASKNRHFCDIPDMLP